MGWQCVERLTRHGGDGGAVEVSLGHGCNGRVEPMSQLDGRGENKRRVIQHEGREREVESSNGETVSADGVTPRIK